MSARCASRATSTNIILAGGIAILMALTFDLVLLAVQRFLTPWRRVAHA